ncbi:MAG: isoleucine--tRNA ligase [Candidatus Dependentiae bacterium]|nr:isoleucine--tRNA ligase [Candidatus Dependentiae bacterium]
MAENQNPESKVSFKDTLNLPRTDFPIRANAKVDDPLMIDRWKRDELFGKSFEQNEGQPKFILHDGPPYANGHIHLGHAYNKILKDIVTKSQRMFGKHVPVTPGWDCHGLPIEKKVTEENPGLSPQDLKKACRVYANKWIDIQREEFKTLGVLMDWDRPYLTMNYEYESQILKAFGQFVADGYIERKNKTVPWCPTDQTVLASAEIEYEERKDPSIYVLFPLEQRVTDSLFANLKGKTVNLLIWTTTPWTLPLNRAVVLKPSAEYVVLNVKDQYVVVGKQLVDKVCALMSAEKNVVAEFNADQLISLKARAHHAFVEGLTVPVLLDQSVLLEDGTACVHSAPGCGPEDYEVGVKNNLEIFSPISPDGKYTVGIMPKELEGMPVTDGQIWVLKKLTELNRLLYKTSIRHPYPHCWRCHGGLIFRATKQWFCDLSRGGLKQHVLEAADSIATIPDKSINRLKATLEGRLEWCLSRQRTWGVPIPSLLCLQCDYTYISPELVDQVADKVAQQGIEYWDMAEPKELLPAGFVCPGCNGTQFKKEQDILDVWFDSGVSHYAVLYNNPKLAFPADMYLEGKDQHHGWFQSSLLTSMVLEKRPCTKMIVTHGFTVDDKGRKMSKSLGNVVTPQQITDKIGTDGLRLWVTTIDSSGEAVISDILVQNVQEVFRKVRNTCRFLLSNLYDFDIERDAVPLDSMRLIDRYALQQLYRANDTLLKKYAEYDFTAVFHGLAEYCTVDLSSFYLDIIKDRLYVEKADGLERRSAQTACWYILDTMTKLIAPILSFSAEQVSDLYQKDKTESIHLQKFASLHNVFELLARQASLPAAAAVIMSSERVHIEPLIQTRVMAYVAEQEQQWQALKEIRSALLKAIEGLRAPGIIKHSLEVKITLYCDPIMPQYDLVQHFFKQLQESGQTVEAFFEEFVIISQCIIADKQGDLPSSEFTGFFVLVEKAAGDKCPRCWQWEVSTHEHKLCKRCVEIVKA